MTFGAVLDDEGNAVDPRWEALRTRMNMSAARLDAIEFSLPEWIRVSAAE